MTERSAGSEGSPIDVPLDATEADLVEQSRPWKDEEQEGDPPEIPVDAPEADFLEQARPADLDEEDGRS